MKHTPLNGFETLNASQADLGVKNGIYFSRPSRHGLQVDTDLCVSNTRSILELAAERLFTRREPGKYLLSVRREMTVFPDRRRAESRQCRVRSRGVGRSQYKNNAVATDKLVQRPQRARQFF